MLLRNCEYAFLCVLLSSLRKRTNSEVDISVVADWKPSGDICPENRV